MLQRTTVRRLRGGMHQERGGGRRKQAQGAACMAKGQDYQGKEAGSSAPKTTDAKGHHDVHGAAYMW